MRESQRRAENMSISKQSEIRRMGSMPTVGSKTVTKTYMEKRGGILGFFLGEKEVTRQVQVPDDSRQRKWKADKARIENTYNNEIRRIRLEENNLERKREELEEERKNISKAECDMKKRAEATKAVLEQKKKELNEKKTHAKHEYLNNQKRKLSEQVSQYFDEYRDKLIDSMRESYGENMYLLKKEVERMFNVGFDLNLKVLENALHNEKSVENWEETLGKITNIREILERYVEVI